MTRFILAGAVSGLLFGVMDGIINANPLARRLLAFYLPIARPSVSAPLGILIDLAYGFAMAWIFLLLYRALPGGAGLAKGVSFALLVWFFRVVMNVVGQWMTIKMPANACIYMMVTGLGEMLVLGSLYGFTLRPS